METWLFRLNIGKCKAISYSRRPELNTNYSIAGVTVENIENIKDLGVTFLSFLFGVAHAPFTCQC